MHRHGCILGADGLAFITDQLDPGIRENTGGGFGDGGLPTDEDAVTAFAGGSLF